MASLQVHGKASVDRNGLTRLEVTMVPNSPSTDGPLRRPPTGTDVKANIIAEKLVACQAKRDLSASKISCQIATICRELGLRTGKTEGQWNDAAQNLLERWLAADNMISKRQRLAKDNRAALEHVLAVTTDDLAATNAALEHEEKANADLRLENSKLTKAGMFRVATCRPRVGFDDVHL